MQRHTEHDRTLGKFSLQELQTGVGLPGQVYQQGSRYVANGRILSDGLCNAYLVDMWTASDLRRQGIGREVVRRLLETVPGQHVGLFTEHAQEFYTSLGFGPETGGMSRVVGSWLGR